MSNSLLDLNALKNTALNTTPFPYVIVSDFVNKNKLADIQKDYPPIIDPGSHPLDTLHYGKNFKLLIEELVGENFRQAVAEKFSMNLANRPTMVTVRGYTQAREGQIHSDSKSKLISVLLYMNPAWENQGGRLRLLTDKNNIDSVVTEIPPIEGTLLVFKVTDNSWHGHKPFEGNRRVIQLNYVLNEEVVKKEASRHRFSSKIKKLKRKFGFAAHANEY